MAAVTYHVALPFAADPSGELVAGEPVEARSPSDSIFKARALAVTKGGAVAFSRTGDDATGEYEPAIVHGRYGDTPDDLTGIGV